MNRHFLAALTLLFAAPALHAQAPSPAPDYAQPATWICRPGADTACTTGLDALVVTADGHRTLQPFRPAANPPIDCFYVYPTVSLEPTPLSDLAPSPEIVRVVHGQAGRLTSRCRLFAPIYRQTTLPGMRARLAAGLPLDNTTPLQDVEAAWQYYLAHDNHGRGVVLIGHSQGTILLQALIAKSIDGTPAQALIVSAILAGDPSLGVPPGKTAGGTFAHIPTCSAAAQTGCAYPWGTFRGNDPVEHQVFGRARTDGLFSACVNPAAPAGGSAPLKFYYAKPPNSPAADPPYIESIGQITGMCLSTPEGNGFHVTVDPAGPNAAALTQMLKAVENRPGWGLHGLDIPLVQGNILDLLDAETHTWTNHP